MSATFGRNESASEGIHQTSMLFYMCCGNISYDMPLFKWNIGLVSLPPEVVGKVYAYLRLSANRIVWHDQFWVDRSVYILVKWWGLSELPQKLKYVPLILTLHILFLYHM